MDPRRLCHISDLPNNLHFLPIEIKHLLPVHHPKFSDNLHTIITHQAHSKQWPVYPDLGLTLSTPYYVVLSGGWCEDIDGKEQHLKASLELSAIILNYLSTLLDSPSQDQEFTTSQTIRRADHIGFNSVPLQGKFPITLAYNIYKSKDKNNNTKFIFMVGYHRSSSLRLYSFLNSVRQWNLHRFKSDLCRDVAPKRIHKVVQHLLIILRGFLPLDQEDHLGKQRQLQLLVQSIDEHSLPKQIPKEGIDDSHQVILSRFEWTYKNSITQRDIAIFIAQVLSELLTITPINVACSFAGKSHHEPKMNQFVLLWMTAFKTNKRHLMADTPALTVVSEKGTQFLRMKTVQGIKDSTKNIADQMLRSSLKVLSRYAPGDQRTNAKDWGNQSQVSRGRQNSIKSVSNSAVVSQIPRNQDFDRMSVISRISFKEQPIKQGKPRADAQFQSLSSPLMAHRDHEYSQLLAFITRWQQIHGNIPTWPQLQGLIKRNCQTAKQRYSLTTSITKRQSQLLLSLAALRRYLEIDQYFLLLKYHTEHRQAIFEVIFQGSSASFLLDLGTRIAKEYVRSLYDYYISKNFTIDTSNLLTSYMKQLVSLFASNTYLSEVGQKVNIPILIQLLQKRQLSGQNYKLLTRSVLPQIFAPNKALRLIAPLLNSAYLLLAEDHHQELVNGLMADLAFETIFFSHDNGTINNSPYRKGKDIKHNKLLQLLREGGFNSMGFQLKTVLKPTIFQFANYSIPSSRIYQEVIINRPLQLAKFVQLIISSTFIQHLPEIVEHFKEMLLTANTVTKSIGNVYLQCQVKEFKWEAQKDIASGVLKSESGVFKYLLEYDPQIKIAGRQLSEVLKTRQSQKPIIPQRFDQSYVISTLFRQNLQEIYEYIIITSNLKEKYDNYDKLKEDQRIYLREIVHQVLCKKSDIVEYLELSFLAKQYTEMEVPFLF